MKNLLFRLWLAYLLIIWHTLPVTALGIVVPPVRFGDIKTYSSRDNLGRCVAYHASPHELVTVSIDVGLRHPSQRINLIVLDQNDNILRSQPDLSDHVTFIFTNPAPMDTPSLSESSLRRVAERIGLVRRSRDSHSHNSHSKNRLSYPKEHFTDVSRIYICFDNIYNDKSWSFTPQDWEVELNVTFKLISQLNSPDYHAFAHVLGMEKNARRLTKSDFDLSMKVHEQHLEFISGSVDGSADILEKLIAHEFGLRDTNENIYELVVLYNTAVMMALAIAFSINLYHVYFTLKSKIRS